MKSRLLKFLAVTACAVMFFSMTVAAADSPDAGDNSGISSPDTSDNSASAGSNDKYVPAADMAAGVTAADITVNGQEVSVTIGITSVADVKNAEAHAKSYFGETAEVIKAFDVSLPEGDYSAGVDITLNVPGVKAGQSVSVLHWNGKEWENLSVTDVSDGSVTATFTSFSPVAVVANPLITSPGTGAPAVYPAVLVMVSAVVGAVFCALRRRRVQ